VTDLAATSSRAAAPLVDSRLTDMLLALFVGGAAFLAIVGPQVLDVTNILWLASTGDSFTHYLGWEFFRRAPWTWPPGLNPDYGLQFSSSIVFSDSVPILALVLKPFSGLMPAVFQYTGWWIFICFLLQAYFATRLAGLFTRDAVVKLALAILLTFAPPMLWRLSVHFSLIPHWIILAAIYLHFAPPARFRSAHWLLLLAVSALIHTYIFAMCVPIWLASLLRRRLRNEPGHWLLEIVAGFGTAALALYLAGFFPLRSDMLSFGYGYFRLNMLSFINPQGGMEESDTWAWSSIMPLLPHVAGDYEGFAYAGLGILAAVALALPMLWTERRVLGGHRVWPLVIAAILLTLFAISPNVAIGDRGFDTPVPTTLMEIASAMRSSGRFFWPVFYLLALGAAWLLYKGMGERTAGVVLLLLAALQVYDTYPGWSPLRDNFAVAGHTLPTTLDTPELAAVASHYNAVRMLPNVNDADGWEQIAWFALRTDKPTDSAYLARPDRVGHAAYMDGIDAVIAAHALETDSLYVVNAEFAAKIAQHMTADDALFPAGDFSVYAPGWSRFGGTAP
jgi:hypothetical protein